MLGLSIYIVGLFCVLLPAVHALNLYRLRQVRTNRTKHIATQWRYRVLGDHLWFAVFVRNRATGGDLQHPHFGGKDALLCLCCQLCTWLLLSHCRFVVDLGFQWVFIFGLVSAIPAKLVEMLLRKTNSVKYHAFGLCLDLPANIQTSEDNKFIVPEIYHSDSSKGSLNESVGDPLDLSTSDDDSKLQPPPRDPELLALKVSSRQAMLHVSSAEEDIDEDHDDDIDNSSPKVDDSKLQPQSCGNGTVTPNVPIRQASLYFSSEEDVDEDGDDDIGNCTRNVKSVHRLEPLLPISPASSMAPRMPSVVFHHDTSEPDKSEVTVQTDEPISSTHLPTVQPERSQVTVNGNAKICSESLSRPPLPAPPVPPRPVPPPPMQRSPDNRAVTRSTSKADETAQTSASNDVLLNPRANQVQLQNLFELVDEDIKILTPASMAELLAASQEFKDSIWLRFADLTNPIDGLSPDKRRLSRIAAYTDQEMQAWKAALSKTVRSVTNIRTLELWRITMTRLLCHQPYQDFFLQPVPLPKYRTPSPHQAYEDMLPASRMVWDAPKVLHRELFSSYWPASIRVICWVVCMAFLFASIGIEYFIIKSLRTRLYDMSTVVGDLGLLAAQSFFLYENIWAFFLNRPTRNPAAKTIACVSISV